MKECLCGHSLQRSMLTFSLRCIRGFSVIHPGTMYDAGPFSTIRDIITPCKVQHRLKLLIDPKQTVSVFLIKPDKIRGFGQKIKSKYFGGQGARQSLTWSGSIKNIRPPKGPTQYLGEIVSVCYLTRIHRQHAS